MSIWKIALRSVRQRGLASALTAGSMALGVMLVVCVLSVHGIVSQQFRTNASLGYNIIIGAKGGKLQLTMNSVYYLSQPIENIPYEYYLEFRLKQERDKEIQLALRGDAMQAQWQALDMQAAAAPVGAPGAQWLASLAATAAAEPHDDRMDLGRNGRFGQFTAIAIPICLGDYLSDEKSNTHFRVVATTVDMFEKLKIGPGGKESYTFSDGRNFEYKNEENGFFEAVIGSYVARKTGLKVGDEISPSHSAPDGHKHAKTFTIVGILDHSGTPNDRGVFVNIEGFFLMDDHAKPIDDPQAAAEEEAADEDGFLILDDDDDGDDDDDEKKTEAAKEPEAKDEPVEVAPQPVADLQPLPLEQREVTAILIRTVNPVVAVGLPNLINEGDTAQAVTPIGEITNLFERIVGPVQRLLFILTVVICIVSGISILVSIYNSMNDRRHEISVMRALGAGRRTVLCIILAEAILLAFGGGLVGWALGHGVNQLASPLIEDQTGVAVSFFDFAPPVNFEELLGINMGFLSKISAELLLIPSLILLAVLVGLLPAVSAYRTDVAQSLGK